MASVLVIGADGFAGRAICAQLAKHGDRVRAIAVGAMEPSVRDRVERSGVTWLDANAKIESTLVSAMQNTDAVVFAPIGPELRGTLIEHNERTLIPIENALSAAQKASVSRFLLVSTDVVTAGDFDRKYDDENLPHASQFLTPFAEVMALAEALVLAATGRRATETTIIRPALVWGPDDTETLPDWIHRAREKSLALIGDGATLMATTYIDNLSRAVDLAIHSPAAAGRIYHITDDERISAKAFLTKVLLAVDVKPPRRKVPYRLALVGAWISSKMGGKVGRTRAEVIRFGRINQYNLQRARDEIGYEPMRIDEGIKQLREWASSVGGASVIESGRVAPVALANREHS